MTQLLDAYGRPVQTRQLTQEIASARIGTVRSPITAYPADGLDPERLGLLFKAADRGEGEDYLELAEAMEERDPHYAGVLGTRRRAVTQIAMTVEAASEDPRAEEQAKFVRDWLKRDELTDELFDILDAVGKGYSMTEIIWDSSEGQFLPACLEYRDPRFFRFDRETLTRPMLRSDEGGEEELPGFRFIYSRIRAKSGLPLRSGLARIVAWTWMFKKYTERDWAIFTQTYGQPLRVGKWGAGASEADKNTLFQAVANIAGDCAAIIPESMMIEFIQSGQLGASLSLYEDRSDWLDKQVSKAVLGQTATTDAETGGLGSGKEHREVQEDIKRADAKALAAILNRDLVRPIIDLNWGPQKVYPKLKIEDPEEEDLKALVEGITPLIDRGMMVSEAELMGKFGLREPKAGERVLGPVRGENPPKVPDDGEGEEPASNLGTVLRGQKRQVADLRGTLPETHSERSQGRSGALADLAEPPDFAALADRLLAESAADTGEALEDLRAMVRVASSMEELMDFILGAYPQLDRTGLTTSLKDAMAAMHAAGRIDVLEFPVPEPGL